MESCSPPTADGSVSQQFTVNPHRPVSHKRLFVLFAIFIVLVVISVIGFFYLETRDRERKKQELAESVWKSQFQPSTSKPQYVVVPPASAGTVPPSIYVSPGKQFLAEDELFRVFILAKGETLELEGSLIIVNKSTNAEIYVEDNFVIFGLPIVDHSDDRRYLWINTGTYVTRGIQMVSLEERRQVASFCSLGGTLYFWENYVIYANCESFDNRPWGGGEASSVVATHLFTTQDKILFKASDLNQFSIDSIDNDLLIVEESYVENAQDWQVNEPTPLSKTRMKTYDLTTLP